MCDLGSTWHLWPMLVLGATFFLGILAVIMWRIDTLQNQMVRHQSIMLAYKKKKEASNV